MTPYYSDDWLTILEGDCRAVLPTLPADSVDCVVTSPPYWGLRDYGTATWEGGDEACDHRNSNYARGPEKVGSQEIRDSKRTPMRSECTKCGATRQDSQLGLERTPEEYVANMVAVFAEVRRVLKPSGTCWLNLGDSYANTGKSGGGDQGRRAENGAGAPTAGRPGEWKNFRPAPSGLKPKDLVGIPWRVAFALQADGWYLRSDIIWSKPNPMPESVTDRPTKAHEYLFLLTKQPRYYFDSEAVREPEKPWNAGWVRAPKFGAERINGAGMAGTTEKQYDTIKGANIRSVWTIATRPYPGAHFAVFPPELPERCIKAGSSERGVCPECGAPWERMTEGGESSWQERREAGAPIRYGTDGVKGTPGGGPRKNLDRISAGQTTGWRPRCLHACRGDCNLPRPHEVHDAVPVPAVVLDPFAGSGTVGMVANRLSRRAILIDLNPEYLRQQMTRNAQTPLGLGAA